jgi:hypothetical protein
MPGDVALVFLRHSRCANQGGTEDHVMIMGGSHAILRGFAAPDAQWTRARATTSCAGTVLDRMATLCARAVAEGRSLHRARTVMAARKSASNARLRALSADNRA